MAFQRRNDISPGVPDFIAISGRPRLGFCLVYGRLDTLIELAKMLNLIRQERVNSFSQKGRGRNPTNKPRQESQYSNKPFSFPPNGICLVWRLVHYLL